MADISLENHEERIVHLEKSEDEQNKQIKKITEDLAERYARIDESNKYLRELSMKQSDQNNKILTAVLSGNQESRQRREEFDENRRKDRNKAIVSIFGASGGLVVLIKIIFDFIVAFTQ